MAQLRPPGKETPKKEKLEHSLSSQSEEQKTAKKIENFPTYLAFWHYCQTWGISSVYLEF